MFITKNFPVNMKKIVLIILFFNSISSASFYDDLDLFYSKYVINGQVKYEEIMNDKSLLNSIAAGISGSLPGKNEAPDIKKAYWINVYNFLVIKSVIDSMPVKSPLKVKGFFTEPLHTIGGNKYSLDQVEKEILFKLDGDPRLHFVLVCAAKSCPELQPYAYRADSLDSLLEERTYAVINDSRYVEYDEAGNTLRLNSIFKWYIKDFERSGGSLIGYLNGYLVNKFPENAKIEYMVYDWNLNQG